MPLHILFCLIFVCGIQVVSGGEFRNLDFEQYNPATQSLPGWSLENQGLLTLDGSKVITNLPVDYGLTDPFSRDTVAATMMTHSFPWSSGTYSLLLFPAPPLYPWYVRQTGEIPRDAKSLSFDIEHTQASLKLNNTEVPLVFEYYGNIGDARGKDFADVSALAGQAVTMEIKATGISPGDPYRGGIVLVDNFRFSPDPVPVIPEPSSLSMLTAFGSLGIGLYLFRRKKR